MNFLTKNKLKLDESCSNSFGAEIIGMLVKSCFLLCLFNGLKSSGICD